MPTSIRAFLSATALAAAVAGPASAHVQVYVGTLSGAKEAPANSSPGTGSATLTIDDHDNTMKVQFSFADLMGTVTAAHIHCCTVAAETGTAGVATTTPTFTGMANGVNLGVKAGAYDHLFDMTLASSWNPTFLNAAPRNGDPGLAFSTLVTAIAEGKAYLNLHTTVVGGGEIRTFFTLAPVPEPESYALMLVGLALVGWAANRRRST
jgi:hypothetical protein